MSKGEVVVLDFWVSPFCMRVKIALGEKGVEYEGREEDLFGGKSELLLKSNPIYQKVPVLLHNGKPLCESTTIVSYIDEVWPSPPLLPPCAYGRAQARFWADFIDKKAFDAVGKIWRSKGKVAESAKKEFIEILKQLEGALGEKDYFGGDSFGFVDVIAIPLTSWFHAVEKFGGFKVEDECPKFSAWMKKCMQKESVAKIIPDPEKVYEFVIMMRKMQGIE
ncbi:probable glutathione S-transferase [Pistacia vera]|uniref:probable glutathione S-transferase n=1 Tax=Pistacia vera TaxID=55513 RepID=UPI001263C468|nr:probable glutathione S-transferase [Pistacia vera]